MQTCEPFTSILRLQNRSLHNDKYYEIEIPKNIGYKQALIKDYKLKLMYGWVLC